MSFKVGDKVWILRPGRSDLHPKREDFWQEEITGETSRSWLVGRWKEKFSKKKPEFWTDEQLEELFWINENKPKILQALYKFDDYRILVQIAGLLGIE